MSLEMDEDGIAMIGGNPFRAGFLLPSCFKNPTQQDLLAATREQTPDFDGSLYHYTSLAGFQGIVESSGFWASDNRYLNDAQELSHGRDLAVSVLDHRMARLESHPFRSILEVVRDQLRDTPREGRLITCFSKARDSLEQWRGYGAGAGVCLRLGGSGKDRIDLASYRPMFFGPDQLPFAVRYSWRSKVVALLSIIRRFEAEYARDKRAMPNKWPDDHDGEYVKYLLSHLEYKAITFKNEAFREEREVRLVFHYSDIGKFEGGLRYRPSPFGLIPYISTGERAGMTGLLPIHEVIVGPSQHQDLVAQSVDDFLRARKYEDVAITLSKVPYRSW